jgi:hypothetical protein
MISMNCRPPRPIDASRPARFAPANVAFLNRPMRNIGSSTFVSTMQNTISSTTPPMRPASTHGLAQPVEWCPYGWIPYVMPASNTDKPTANVMLPHQSIRPARRVPSSCSERYDQIVPTTPIGTLTQNTERQSHSASTPPRTRPMNEPAIAATWLMPRAMPRCRAGNASVRIAVELAKIIAPPTA